jgi:hypothetical protein
MRRVGVGHEQADDPPGVVANGVEMQYAVFAVVHGETEAALTRPTRRPRRAPRGCSVRP